MNKFLVIVAVLFLLSCGKDDEVVVNNSDTIISAWLDTAGITTAIRDDNGIYYYAETTNATGTAVAAGDVLAIYYNLYDLSNALVASHQRADGDSLIFKHGVSAAYPVGLDIGVGYMRLGEMYSFLIPPNFAYSQLTSGALNADSVYRLQVELVGIHVEDNLFAQEIADITNYIDTNFLDSLAINPLDSVDRLPSGLSYKRLSAGTGNLPLNGDTVVVDYNGAFLDGSGNFDTGTGFQWIYGSNNPRELIPGFEVGVGLMQIGENAQLFIPSSQAYRESALVVPASIIPDLIIDNVIPDYVGRVPAYKTLIFNINRVD